MTGFIPVMDFSILPSISQLPSHYPCSKNSPGFMPNCFWTGAKIKKRKASLKTLPGHLFEDAPGIFFFHPIAISKKYPYLCSSF